MTPYLDASDDANRIESNLASEEIGEFTFEDTAQGGSIVAVMIAVCTYGDAPLGTYDVFMYEPVGGWMDVGNVTVTASYQRHSIDISAKFNTWAKINGAKMRLRRTGS